MGTLAQIRDLCVTAIQNDITAKVYAYNGFTCAKTHIPVNQIEDPDLQAGKSYCLGRLLDDGEILTRGTSRLCAREVSILTSFQVSNVLVADLDRLDQLNDTAEGLRNTIRKMTLPEGTRILRIECLRNEDGTPYHYYMAREGNTFETYFTAYFQQTLS